MPKFNNRAAKRGSIHLQTHSVKPGVHAFRKQLRNQYGRRLWNRELKVWTREQNTNPVSGSGGTIKRPESSRTTSRKGLMWVLDSTMAEALRKAGL